MSNTHGPICRTRLLKVKVVIVNLGIPNLCNINNLDKAGYGSRPHSIVGTDRSFHGAFAIDCKLYARRNQAMFGIACNPALSWQTSLSAQSLWFICTAPTSISPIVAGSASDLRSIHADQRRIRMGYGGIGSSGSASDVARGLCSLAAGALSSHAQANPEPMPRMSARMYVWPP